MKIRIIAAALMVTVSPLCLASGPWIEMRDSWETAHDKNEIAIRGGYDFESMAGVMLTNAYYQNRGTHKLEHGWNEIEAWAPLVQFSPKWYMFGGAVLSETTDGTGESLYADVRFIESKDFSVTARYRYVFRNYDTLDLDSQNNRDDFHWIAMFWNYRINENWFYSFEPDLFIRANNYHAGNGKRHNYEMNNNFSYTGFKHWQPYFELSWIDRSVEKHEEDYRVRVGLRYNF